MSIIVTKLILPRDIHIDLAPYIAVELYNIRIWKKIEYLSELDPEICRIEYKPERLNIRVSYARNLPEEIVEALDEHPCLVVDSLPKTVHLEPDHTAYIDIGEEEVRILVYSDMTGGLYESRDIYDGIKLIVKKARATMPRNYPQ